MKRTIPALLTLVMLFALTACGAKEEAPSEAVSFKVIVTDLEGNETTFGYSSSASNVGEVLVAEGLVVGHDADYGLYIDSVNGIAADWDNDQTYWAFYINGEYATALPESAGNCLDNPR